MYVGFERFIPSCRWDFETSVPVSAPQFLSFDSVDNTIRSKASAYVRTIKTNYSLATLQTIRG